MFAKIGFYPFAQLSNLLYGWGNQVVAGIYPLGDGTATNDYSSPVLLNSSSWVKLSRRFDGGAAIKGDGTLWVWGENGAGQLGLGDTTDRSVPVQVSGSYTQVSVGQSHMVAIDTLGRLYTTGEAGSGQLGHGNLTDLSSLTQVGSSSWVQCAAGFDYTLAIDALGRLFSWGEAGTGALGSGNTTDRSSPVQIGTSSWVQVDAGGSASDTGGTVAIDAVGRLFCWGTATLGANGDGSSTSRSSPVQISGGGSWVFAARGRLRGAAIKTDGTLWAWGDNTSGCLGDGSSTNRSSPVQVSGGGSWSYVALPRIPGGSGLKDTTQAIKSTGLLFAWGENSAAELGIGDTTDRSSPVQVSGGGSWLQVAIGNGNQNGIRISA